MGWEDEEEEEQDASALWLENMMRRPTERDTRPRKVRPRGDVLPSGSDAWLAATARYRLLSAAEEVACAQVMEARGKDGRSPVCPTRNERGELCDCRTAQDTMVNHNLRLVVSVARGYKLSGTTLAPEDAWQYGVIGLIRAAQKFKWQSGNRFSTVATWWIWQAVSRNIIDEGYMVREPSHMVQKRARAYRDGVDTSTTYGPRIMPLTLDAFAVPGDPASGTIADFVPDERAVDPTTNAADADQSDILAAALETVCTPRERLILAFRMEGKTLEDVAAMFTPAISRERVRQLQDKALTKLRLALTWDHEAGGIKARGNLLQFVQSSLWSPRRGAQQKKERKDALRLAPIVSEATTQTETREPKCQQSTNGLATTTEQPTRRRASLRHASKSNRTEQEGTAAAGTSALSDKSNTTVARVTRGKRLVPGSKQMQTGRYSA